MRRATSAPMLVVEAFILVACLGGFQPGWLTPGGVAAWQRTLPPTMLALVALLLRDAYRTTDRWTAARAACDILAVTVSIGLSQALVGLLASRGTISPDWRVAPFWLYGGMLFALMMLFILRTGVDLVAPAPAGQGRDVGHVVRDYQAFRTNVRVKNWVENGVLAIIVAIGLWADLRARPVVAAIGFAWGGLTLALIAYNLARGAPRPLPREAGLRGVVDLYRHALERQRRAIRFVWWWYYVPLFAGLGANLVAPGVRAGAPLPAFAGLACVAALATGIARLNRERTRQLERKSAELGLLAA